MSLLRDVLRKNNAHGGLESPNELSLSSRKTMKKYAASVRSSSGASIRSLRSIAGSIASFYTTLTGTRIPKRRRPDVSRLGVPKWYRANPPPAEDIPGTKRLAVDSFGPFTASHASSLKAGDEPPWLSVVLHNYATPQSHLPRYFNEAKVQGEVRLVLRKPKNVASIDIWLLGKAESVLELGAAPLVRFHANLWKRSTGTLERLEATVIPGNTTAFKGKLPAGSYLFASRSPFEFPALPQDVPVELPPEDVEREGSARVFLPPTASIQKVGGFDGRIKYFVGVNVRYDGIGDVNDGFDMQFAYYPRARPTPRETVLFPFIPTREDWPFQREVVGGWTLTPFGGRGRFEDEIVEIEGILGVQAPEVYVAGQTVRFGLLLWSTSPAALKALSDPDSFDVVFMRTEIYGTDVLRPRNAARRNRNLVRLSQGRIWRTEDGPPLDDIMPELRPGPTTTKAREPNEGKMKESKSSAPRRPAASRLQQSFIAPESRPLPSETSDADTNTMAVDATSAESGAIDTNDSERPRTPSPTPSFEDLDDESGADEVVRLDGDVRVVQSMPPSFRYKYMGCEYTIHLTITHPDYLHISPSGLGIQAETPLWIVTDAPQSEEQAACDAAGASDPVELPITGTVAEVSTDAIRAPQAFGGVSTKERPTWRTMRMAAF